MDILAFMCGMDDADRRKETPSYTLIRSRATVSPALQATEQFGLFDDELVFGKCSAISQFREPFDHGKDVFHGIGATSAARIFDELR